MIVFRVDSSTEIGSGHVMRCLTLADKLKESGKPSLFISADLEGNLGALVKSRGFDQYYLEEKKRK